MMYQYFVKIVPTIYVKTDGEVSEESKFCILFLNFGSEEFARYKISLFGNHFFHCNINVFPPKIIVYL